MRIFQFTLLLLVFAVWSSASQADVIFWEDSKYGVTLTYPDTWRRINNQEPDDILTIAAPSGEQSAYCKIRARDDRRYMIYPPHLHPDVQKVAVNQEFWQEYISDYYDPVSELYYDESGLGSGYGSYALAEYGKSFTGGFMRRRGMLLASLYNGNVFIMECSARKDSYVLWAEDFMSIARTVEFDKKQHELYTGNYRDFLGEGFAPIYFRDVKRLVGKTY